MARNTSKWLEMAPNGSKSLKPLKKKGQKVPKSDKRKKKKKKKKKKRKMKVEKNAKDKIRIQKRTTVSYLEQGSSKTLKLSKYFIIYCFSFCSFPQTVGTFRQFYLPFLLSFRFFTLLVLRQGGHC